MKLSTLTKPILKNVFINYIQNKVVQLSIMQLPKETTFYVDIQWFKKKLWTINNVSITINCKYTLKMIQIITKFDELMIPFQFHINFFIHLIS